MDASYMQPEVGRIYTNRGGGTYLCHRFWQNPYTIQKSFDAQMTNVKSGWSIIACGLLMYEDGTIEWDYSKNGHFATPSEFQIHEKSKD